ncbi:MAG: minichromosome maintenance protein MCM [Thermoplasmata archaeon]
MATKYINSEIKENFRDLFEEKYSAEIMKIADHYPDEMSLFVSYQDMIIHFGDEFPRFVIDNPKRCFTLAEEAMIEMSGVEEGEVEAKLRLTGLPAPRNIGIRDLRASDLTKFVAIDGLVRRVTEVRPRISKAVFQCLRCGGKTWIDQESSTHVLEEPAGCSECGKDQKKSRMIHILEESEFKNYQNIEVQETPEGLRGGEQPQRLKGWVEDDLVGQISPGDRITINGIIDGSPKSARGGAKSRNFDIFIRTNSIEMKEYEYQEVELSEEDRIAIEEAASQHNVFQKLVGSIAPSIHKMIDEKMGLALQLFGGVRKTLPDEQKIRGDIHILMVGDPGTAKSQLLRYISDLSPRGMYTSGKGSTGAGLTAAAMKDEVMGESRWILEAGTLVLADKGIAAVDELDKMREEDRSSMHEAMEQQTISVAKAGINARLNARCALLGAANPRHGRFEPHENISQQIKLPAPLISRFDLIFAIMDKPDKTRDLQIAKHILKVHHSGEMIMNEREGEIDNVLKPEFDKEFMRKYVAHAKKISPIMTDECMQKLEDFFMDIRGSGGDTDSIPITARQLESLIRLSEASARAHLRDKVISEDAERAIKVTRYFLNQVASTEGGFDIDLVASDISHSERTLLHEITRIIREMTEFHENGVPEDVIVNEAEERGRSRTQVKKELKRMSSNGTVYRPSGGKYLLT